jgi:hypothetical protein
MRPAQPALNIYRNPVNGTITGTGIGAVTTDNDYNDFGEVSATACSVDWAPVYRESYGVRDKLGRIVTKTETIEARVRPTVTTTT